MRTIDDFDLKYTPDASVISSVFDSESQAGMLETHGADYRLISRLNMVNPKKIWTCMDGDNGQTYIVAGFHWVNRIYYFVSNEEYSDENEAYLINGSDNE